MTDPFKDFEVITIDCGDSVLCDLCNKDYTNSNISGGFLFGSNAVCPDCVTKMIKTIKEYKEEKYIKAWCPDNKSFADWIREDLR